MVAHSRGVVAIGIALAIGLTSCGGRSHNSSPGQSTPTSAPTAPSIAVPEGDSPADEVEALVSGLQIDSKSLGYDPGNFSGEFSSSTQQALIEFQTKAALPTTVCGSLGPATAAALQSRLGTSCNA